MNGEHIQVAIAAKVSYSSSRPSRSGGGQGSRSQKLLILAVEIDGQGAARTVGIDQSLRAIAVASSCADQDPSCGGGRRKLGRTLQPRSTPRAGDGLGRGQLHAVKMTDGTGRRDLGLSENPDQSCDNDPSEDAGKNNSFEAQWKLLEIAGHVECRKGPVRVLLLLHMTA